MLMILMTVFFIMQILVIVFFCLDHYWEYAKHNDLIEFINDCDTAELEKNIKIGRHIDDPTRDYIIQIIQKYWD